MFIGEMGCWLVVGAFHLASIFQRKRTGSTGYEQVSTTEESQATDESDENMVVPSSPIMKAMTANREHPELKGLNILLLGLPAGMLPFCYNARVTLLKALSS